MTAKTGLKSETITPGAHVGSEVAKNDQVAETVNPKGSYKFACMGPVEEFREKYVDLRNRRDQAMKDGNFAKADSLLREMELIPQEEKWTDTVCNLVFTAAKNDLLDKYLAGSAYTAAWYLLLVDGASAPTFNAADTSASHAGWTESTAYSNATRPAPSWNAAASSSKASTATAFNINATATIAGAGLISNSTKGGTTGILYSAGSFSANRPVVSGDTLNVTYTANA